jgi:integrase
VTVQKLAINWTVGNKASAVSAFDPKRTLVLRSSANSKEALDKRIAEKTKRRIPHWTPHDLRRAFSTYAHELGVESHIVEAVINHVSGHRGGVAGTYNRARYEPAKRSALMRWANHLTALVEGRESNVIPVRHG